MSGKQPKNEVKVTRGDGKISKYVKYIYGLFKEGKTPYKEVVIKGAGHAISTVIPLVELLKTRIKNLHQVNNLSHFTVKDNNEDEGKPIERRIVLLTVTLTIDPKEEQRDHYGYQEPLPQELIEEFKEYDDEYEDYGEEGYQHDAYNKGGDEQD